MTTKPVCSELRPREYPAVEFVRYGPNVPDPTAAASLAPRRRLYV